MMQTYEKAASTRDHASVQFFPPLVYAVDSGAARVDGDCQALRRCAAVFGSTAN